ncbi:unnamed protein product [Rotaria sp. Silwood2]|nr:unnamed protein product [Rotaria sp. Silwood2]
MPARKTTARYSLYRTFVDAYMKAHSEKTRSVSHSDAQSEWNQLKSNEKHVQEKIDTYLEKYRSSSTSGLNLDQQDENEPKKKNRGRKKKCEPTIEFENGGRVTKRRKKREESSDPDFDPDSSSPPPKQEKIRTAAEILAKKSKAPAQDKVSKELHEINERIIQLVQVKNMGMATNEQEKQLKKLLVEQKKKSNDLKRLKAEQAAKKRYREIKKRKIEALCEKNPELAAELNKIYRPVIGRPPIEEECPDLLQIIEEIAKVGGAADDNRRSQTIRPCLTLDDLREKIKERGYDIKRSTLYYRLLPHRINSVDGKKHVRTVPVRLRKALNDEHGKHEGLFL